MTFSAGDAHDYCIYKGRFRFSFPIYDNVGGLVTAAAGLDSVRSINFAAGSACTNEATEFTTAPLGMYWLDLTSAETTGSNVSGVTKTTTTNAKATPWSWPIIRLPILESGTAQAGAAGTITLASGASAKDGFYAGLYVQCSNDTPANVLGQTRKIVSYVGSTRVATVESNWGTNPSSSTTYDVLIPLTANLAAVLGQRMPDWATAGIPKVDVGAWLGTTVATPGTAGVPSVDAVRHGGTIQTGRDIGSSVLLSAGTGTGQLDFTLGIVKSSLVQILGTALTETSGQIAAAFKKFFDKATPTGTINSLPDAVAGGVGGVFIAGTNAATSVTTALTANITGNVSGSVGSVTGLTAANLDVAVSTRLAPTSAGRTLDISLGGEAGIDWANVGTPGSTVALSATTVGTATTVTGGATSSALTTAQASLTDIQGRLPAALSGGRMDSAVGALGANVLTAASAASDFGAEIADAVWDEAISGHLGVGSTGAGLNAAGSSGDPWTTLIPGAYAAGTAGHRLGNVPDVIAGAAGGLFIAGTNAATSVTTALTANITGNISGSVGSVTGLTAANLDATISSRATASAMTNAASDISNIQSRLPTVLVSGRMDASTGAITATPLAAVADAVWDENLLSHSTADSTGAGLTTATAPSTAELADAVWDEVISGHVTPGTTGASLIGAGAAGDPWTAVLPGGYADGSAGKIFGDRIDAAVSSRATPTNVSDAQAAVLAKLPTALISGRMDVTIGAAQANVITQASIATDARNGIADSVWDELLTGHIVPTSAGSELATAALPPSPSEISDAVWDEALAGHSGVGSAGEGLMSVGDPWTAIIPGEYANGTAGQILGGRIDETVSSRATSAATDEILAKLPEQLIGGRMSSHVVSADPGVIGETGSAGAILDTPVASHATAGTVGGYINEIHNRLPTALVNNKMNASVSEIRPGVLLPMDISTESMQAIVAAVRDISGQDPVNVPPPEAPMVEKIDYICAQFTNLQIVNRSINEMYLYRRDQENKIATVKFSGDEQADTRRDAAI